MRLVDAHCHLEVKDYPDVMAVLEQARAAGLVHAIVVGQFHGPGDWGNALELAARHPDFLSPTLGIHPHEAARATEDDLATLEKTCARPEVRAVGEAGLDYYYDNSPRDVQARVFRHQCALALKLGKPLVVHVRDAHDDCEAILRETGVTRGVIHCFTGDTAAAKRYLDLGFHLSLSGVVTYKKTEALQAAVQYAPLDRLLVETDSPYLAPVPHRGRRNEPAWVSFTVARLAAARGATAEAMGRLTTANARAFFALPTPPAAG